MNLFFLFFFSPKTGHFEHIIRHYIKNFEKKIIFSFQILELKKTNLKLLCVSSAAKHNKSRCALLKEVRFQVTWKNVVQTCHTPLESLDFSGSFGVKNYFLNQIFVNKKIRKTKVRKKINELILKWMSRSMPVSAALVTYTKRTAEI
jgi:hypothetical protein